MSSVIKIPIAVSSPGTWGYTPGQTIYNEMLAYEILNHAAAATAEGLELTFDTGSDAWSAQGSSLGEQQTLLASLSSDPLLPAVWSTRLGTLGTLLSGLLTFDYSPLNFVLRNIVLMVVEQVISRVSGIVHASPEGESEVAETLKAAFLKETIPESGVFDQTTLSTLQDILQATEDLKYNEEMLEFPATPRPLKIFLKNKTLQT